MSINISIQEQLRQVMMNKNRMVDSLIRKTMNEYKVRFEDLTLIYEESNTWLPKAITIKDKCSILIYRQIRKEVLINGV